MNTSMYETTKESLSQHTPPLWYQNAKLGIFIHWGLYSVPAFAPTKYGDITKTVGDHGFEFHFKNNPYAEWYLNSLRVGGEDYREFHEKTFGSGFEYDGFIPMFNEANKKWDPTEWARLFKEIGAQYVVITTKHHDGFRLWPSSIPNPLKGEYHAKRNIVSELTAAVRREGLKMGLYYSGGLDWTFNLNAIYETTTMLSNAPRSKEYGEYIDRHVKELIDLFKPDVLWNDIAYPMEGKLADVIAYYYNQVPDGVINDRWKQIPKVARFLAKTFLLKRIINFVAKKVVKSGGFEGKAPGAIGDYSTPEYEPNARLRTFKWESCRGIGRSFGYNRMETAEHYLSPQDLIHSFIDIVSKNGNPLLNIGPMADGTIPDLQRERLMALGKFLKLNGEGIYGTKPWTQSDCLGSDNTPIRFTYKESVDNQFKTLYLFTLGIPKTKSVRIDGIHFPNIREIIFLESAEGVTWNQHEKGLEISVPDQIQSEYALGFSLKLK